MPDGNRVLVPIDGSDHSLRALAHVIKRVEPDRQPKIFVLNVQLPFTRRVCSLPHCPPGLRRSASPVPAFSPTGLVRIGAQGGRDSAHTLIRG